MPSLQVVDLSNEAPQQNYVGNFARSFGETLNTGRQKKSDEDIFNRIKQQYPTDSPDQTAQRLIESTASAPFKKDTLGYLTSLATNQARRQDQDIRRDQNEINRDKVLNDNRRLNQSQDKQKTDLPAAIAKYNKSIWKDAEPEDLSLFNRLTSKYMAGGLSLDQASSQALQEAREVKQALDMGFTEKESGWFRNPDNTENEELVVNQAKSLINAGTKESIIKSNLKKAGWSDADIIRIMDRAKVDNILFGG